MKQLFAGVVLILVLGVAAFLYRNVTERPLAQLPNGPACTEEAKVCPDGTSVTRTGPACVFAACAFPNVEIADAKIAFAIPSGYVADENAVGANPEVLAGFSKPSSVDVGHSIMLYEYPIKEGETADGVILAHTRFQPSDMQAESIDELKQVTIGGKTFYVAVIERFEGQVHSSYFLPREGNVLRFDIIEHDVNNWTDAALIVSELPEHKALQALLQGLQVS